MHGIKASMSVGLLLLLTMVATVGSAQAAAFSWSSPKPIDSQAPFSSRLEGAACPSASLCVLGDNSHHVLTSTAPATEAWSSSVATSGGFADLSCPSSSFCAGVSGAEVNISTNPTGGVGAWTATEIDPSFPALLGISCASASMCVAVDDAGHLLTSTNPTGGAGAWNLIGPIGSTGRLYGVSCPTESFCAAVGVSGAVLTSTNPTGGGGTWTATTAEPGEAELFGISCSSASFCAATGSEGTIITSTNPTGGAGSWSVAHIGNNESLGGALGRISCPSATFCATGSNGGYIATSSNPTGGAGTWTLTAADGGRAILSVACSSGSLCIAGDSEGSIITGSTEPKIQHAVNASRAGSGAGVITSSPGGIDCGAMCSASFTAGTTITLTATAEPGSSFAGWSGGGCSGTGACVLQVNSDLSIIGTFERESSGGGSGSGGSPSGGTALPSPAPTLTPSATKPTSKPLVCRKGFKKQKFHGKAKCVKVKKARKKRHARR